METKGNTDSQKIVFLEFFQKNLLNFILKFPISRFFSIKNKKTPFLAVFMVFVGLLLASNVQRWIKDVQKCSSLNQLRPKMSKLKSAGTALNIAENAKISESALKMTEYLWELNPGVNCEKVSFSKFPNEKNTRILANTGIISSRNNLCCLIDSNAQPFYYSNCPTTPNTLLTPIPNRLATQLWLI